MVKKICLDSNVIISLLKNQRGTDEALSRLDAEFVTTSITSFEVCFGRTMNEPVMELLNSMQVLPFDDDSARKAADLQREFFKTGSPIELKDLFIGSICISNHVELWTYNTKDFERLQRWGLRLTSWK